jgi:hypothetical protein
MTELKEDTRLLPKMKKFARRVAKTGEILKSATDVGYKGNYGSQLMKNEKIQTAIQVEMDRQGTTTERIVEKIDEGMEAYRVIRDGGKKYPDFHVRKEYVDIALKIRGDYAPEKHEIRQEKLILVITPETIKGLKDAGAITDDDAEVITAEAIEEEEINATG